MMRSFQVISAPNGVSSALVFRPLTLGEAGQLADAGVTEIEINDSKGWQGGSINFVRQLPNLRSLKLLSMLVPASELESIQTLHQLEALQLHTFCKTPINFSFLQNLRKCNLVWRLGCESLFDCPSLESLCLIKYNKPDLTIRASESIRRFHLLQSRIKNLNFISSLRNLTHLTLGAIPTLVDTDGIESATKLVRLDIESTRGFTNLNWASKLSDLEFLCLNDLQLLESLAPLSGLSKLNALFFWGSTKILDGKISFLKSLPALSFIAFQNRRHYDCKCESFSQYYNQYPETVEAY